METELQEVKNRLMATNEEFSRLAKEHSQYAQQLEELSSQSHLTESEQMEEVKLKKRKLFLKDQMEKMIQEYRREESEAVQAT